MIDGSVKAFFGLGAMGFPIALHLTNLLRLSVHDPLAARVEKLRAAAPPNTVLRGETSSESAQTAFLCLPDQATVRGVVEQLLETGTAGRRIIDFGAHEPEFVMEMAELCISAGSRYCDAPVFGTPGMAMRGELYFLFSGEAGIAEEFKQIADALKFRMRHAGQTGTASTIKLLQNALGTVNLAIGAEALQLCDGMQVDKQLFIGVVRECGGIGYSRVFDRFGEDMAACIDSGEGRLRIAAKDMHSAVRLAKSCDIDAPILSKTSEKFERAMGAGFGDRQFTSIFELPANAGDVPDTGKEIDGAENTKKKNG